MHRIPLHRPISLIFLLSCLIISGCMSTSNDADLDKPKNQRASLSDLAEQQGTLTLEKFTADKAVRAEKLAEIYQQLLTLEPDPQVKTKVEYRLVQINTEVFENESFGGTDNGNGVDVNLTLAQLKKDDKALTTLIVSYQ